MLLNQMASQQKDKKRCLPAWMKSVHGGNPLSVDKDVVSDGAKCSKVDSKVDATTSVGGAKSSSTSSYPVRASDVICEAMPFLSFPGTAVYCNTFSDCSCFCEELLKEVEDSDIKKPVGFDMEWPVSYARGKSDKTALIQMCFTEENCFLFHVSAIGKLPKLLDDLISHTQLILVGLNIETDLWKLERDFDIRVKPLIDRGSIIDVGKLANKKLKTSERWDLDGLCKNVLQKRLKKDASIRCGSWTHVPLSQRQRDYAVADAYAGLKLYQVLSS